MKTKAVRLYGKNDLRLEEFELPVMKDDEILALIISDSICMSTYKAAIQGNEHKRVPKNIEIYPTMIGHEFCGNIIKVGKKWKYKFKENQKFVIQPALNLEYDLYAAPGYSFQFLGGDATYVIISNEVMEQNCMFKFDGDSYFKGSSAEPLSCIVGAFHANYHTVPGSYIHKMGIVDGGNMAILAGAGSMGLWAIDYAVHCERKPKLIVVTDIDDAKLRRAESICSVEEAKKNNVDLIYVNTANMDNVNRNLLEYTDGKGFDDVFVLVPVKSVVELADKILGKDGCLNFFPGPMDQSFTSDMNFYNIHYNSTHAVGISGGNTDDMIESISLIEKGVLNPASAITHIGGLDSVIDATLNLPKIPGGKKLIYTNIKMELTAIVDFREKGEASHLFSKLAEITERNNGLWSSEAEKFLLSNADSI